MAQFDHIPARYVQAASNLRVLWRHASTGGYISQGLDCLQYKSQYNDNPVCSVYPRDYYNRDNWLDALWNPACDNSPCKPDQFYDVLVNQGGIANTDVAMMKYCYDDAIMLYDPPQGYNEFPHYQSTMDTLEAAYPQKDFVWWTAPTMVDWTGLEGSCTDLNHYNITVRNYVNAHSKVLFDVADIESYSESGSLCYQPGECPHMCSEYGSSGGGHPNQVGSVHIGKAFWVMMARLAGWDGHSTQ